MIEENTPVGVPLGKPLEEAAVQAFAAEFRGALIRPGDEAYGAERAVFNAMIAPSSGPDRPLHGRGRRYSRG